MFEGRPSITLMFKEGMGMKKRLPRKMSSFQSVKSLHVKKGTEEVINVDIKLLRIWQAIVHQIRRCGWSIKCWNRKSNLNYFLIS